MIQPDASAKKPRSHGEENIWTSTARDLLFQQLVDRFGPYSEWALDHSPGRGLEDEFENFLIVFAELIGASSPLAVEMQIAFATPVTNRAEWRQGHVQAAILNIAAALNAGFISNKELPALLVASGGKDSLRSSCARGDFIVPLKPRTEERT